MSDVNTPTEPMPDCYGHTIFCEDIRFEVDGKTTLVGVFNQLLIARSGFPLLIPKLCFSISFNQKHEIYTRDLRLRIFLPGDSDDRASIEADPKQADTVPQPIQKFGGEYMGINMNLVFSPFTIESGGRIKVRMLRDGVLHRMGTLLAMTAEEFNASKASSASPPQT